MAIKSIETGTLSEQWDPQNFNFFGLYIVYCYSTNWGPAYFGGKFKTLKLTLCSTCRSLYHWRFHKGHWETLKEESNIKLHIQISTLEISRCLKKILHLKCATYLKAQPSFARLCSRYYQNTVFSSI